MVLKFYAGSPALGATRMVALILAEKEIPFELVIVDMKNNQHKSPEFLAMHPFGQLPIVDDEGFILYENRAICRYLVEKYPNQGTKLAPIGLKEKAFFEQAASVESANLTPPTLGLLLEAVVNPYYGRPVDQVKVTEMLKELNAKLEVYEIILGKQKYVAGDQLTLIDLFHLMFAPVFASAGIDVMTSEKRPNVTRWWNELISRPTWVKLMAEGVKGTVN